MSATAPALAKTECRIIVVRLADVSVAVAGLSSVFSLLLIFFPESFPRIVVSIWERGDLMVAMASFALLLDTCLYLRIAYMMSAKPGILAAMCLGCVPIFVVAGCNLLLQGAIAGTLAINISNPQGRIGEEILAHTYLGLISAVFLPFLVIRLLLQFKSEEA